MSRLISHLESRLGQIQSGWTRNPGGKELSFQVVELSGGEQLEGSTSYATLGLSRHQLATPEEGKSVWMELLMTTHSALAPARLPQAIQAVATALLARQAAILRGDTFSLPGPVAEGSRLSSIYAAVPGYFDEEFDSVTMEDGTGVAIVWLVPIADSEKSYIDDKGWSAFEENLVDRDPDLLDLFRESIC